MSENKELEKAVKKISEHYKFIHVVNRALLTGLFTAVGATIGFAIVILVMSKVLSGLKEIPLVDTILQQTKLDVVIENQLSDLSSDKDPTATEPTIKYLNHESEELNISFLYPNVFTKIQDNSESSSLTGGTEYIQEIIISNQKFDEVAGDFYTVFTENNRELRVYENGAVVNSRTIANPVYVSEFTLDSYNLHLIATAQSNTPGTGREIILHVLSSVE